MLCSVLYNTHCTKLSSRLRLTCATLTEYIEISLKHIEHDESAQKKTTYYTFIYQVTLCCVCKKERVKKELCEWKKNIYERKRGKKPQCGKESEK